MSALTWAWRALNALMAALFVASAAVQHNDPDPLPWMLLYGLAALAALAAAARRAPALWAAALAAAAFVWAATLAPALASVDLARPFDDEVARELGGLTLVGIWAALIAVEAAWRQHRASTET